MKNNIDFIYEYSDLNLFQTRVKILTGEYAGIILEFGGSVLAQIGDKNTFTFEYTLYEVPDKFYGPSLRKDSQFNKFLGYLLVDVISCRNSDPKEQEKLFEAAQFEFMPESKIKISDKWYAKAPKKLNKKQPKTNLESF